jgi:hypothetical protein
MLSHHNLVANLCQLQPVLELGEEETDVAVLPFFHAYGQVVLMAAAQWQGATLVTLPRFDLQHKKVRAVEFIDQVPRPLWGKIPRRVLMDREPVASSTTWDAITRPCLTTRGAGRMGHHRLPEGLGRDQGEVGVTAGFQAVAVQPSTRAPAKVASSSAAARSSSRREPDRYASSEARSSRLVSPATVSTSTWLRMWEVPAAT